MKHIPEKMRAVILTGHGGIDKLRYVEDYTVPKPNKGEVLVRVSASSVNNTDINTRIAWYADAVTEGVTMSSGESGFGDTVGTSSGWSRSALKFPRIQGADICGEIVAVGDGVSTQTIGTRILADVWIRDSVNPLDRSKIGCVGSECDGGFVEYVVIPFTCAQPIRSSLSDLELASFPCAYTTAENLVSRSRVGADDTVLITGASGDIGSAAIQLCKRRGAAVIGMAGIAKHSMLESIGADALLPRQVDDLAAELVPYTGDGRVDIVLDTVGGSQFGKLIHQLRPEGRYASCGAIAGPIVSFDVRDLIYQDLEFYGGTIPLPHVFKDLVNYIERNEIKPIVAKAYDLEQLPAAQKDFMTKQAVGKIVVKVSR